VMSDLLYTKWFWMLICLVLGCTLSFQIGAQCASAKNNTSGAQLERVLGQLDAATRQKLSDTSNQDASANNSIASINENSR